MAVMLGKPKKEKNCVEYIDSGVSSRHMSTDSVTHNLPSVVVDRSATDEDFDPLTMSPAGNPDCLDTSTNNDS